MQQGDWKPPNYWAMVTKKNGVRVFAFAPLQYTQKLTNNK